MAIRRWIFHESPPETLPDKTKHLLVCSDEEQLEFRELLGGHIRESYMSPERIQEILEENGLARLAAQIRAKFPQKRTTKIGEFGEIVCRVVLEEVFGLWVPVIKIRYKTHRDIPVHGMDVVAFRFRETPAADTLYLAEVKTASSCEYCKSSQREIKKRLSVLDLEQILDEIDHILQWLPESGSGTSANRERSSILAFYNRYEQERGGMVRIVPFLVQEAAYWTPDNVADLVAAVFDYPANVVAVKLRGLSTLIDEAYRCAGMGDV